MPADLDQQNQALLLKRRRQRSIALGLVLAAFCLIVYILTFVKMGMYHTL